jgi:hypothetical protein
MVFGGAGDRSASGVAFSGIPAAGATRVLPSGGRRMSARARQPRGPGLRRAVARGRCPEATATPSVRDPGGHYHDMQDIEFTIQRST